MASGLKQMLRTRTWERV